MYLCFNVVCAEEGEPQGTFLRAVRPTEGAEIMAKRRGLELGPITIQQLCNGPSKLCQAFGITRSMNGMDVCGKELFFTEGEGRLSSEASPRIGIDYAGPGRDWPRRFVAKGDPFASKRR
jgi:DNA-3-methyladenine glycosylase